ncbi:3-oxoacyl-[acyl-carrier-protein] reductase FabG [Caulifigura coniformis]|uniref:3-oxoacyl-[acyl-carrier-protein] reductase FabG n=1 Tax=Caulifigura coniformis TaxID=2527983 RepID=A0A517SKK4_9PLAN|nr:SDR family oxidoreductase [Caulifigura coniformis]QDT56644.1 3-oxoacyl-[acyl-carrier-protein] reductase FabG [Caulifigura coniformis]
MPQERVLVTGASSGIGRELALQFAENRNNLVLVARSRDKLEALEFEVRTKYGVTAEIICADLSQEGQVRGVFEETERRGLQVDILVNNAGFGDMAHFWDVPAERYLQTIAVNVGALTQLTRLYLPGMMQRKKGRILNVASTASFQPGPNVAVYFATKAYVLSLSEALSIELRGTGVTVTCLAPGPTLTGFGDQAHMQHTPLFRFAIMEAEPVAKLGYNATMKGKPLVIPGFINKTLAFSSRLWPRQWIAWTTGKLHPLK